jgi:uncharacterized membrane protein
MMRLLARMHGARADDGSESSAKASAIVGVIAGGVVIAHLVALGASGALLFLRFGTGYSGRETVFLAGLATLAVVALGRTAFVFWRRNHGPRIEP